MRQNKTSYRQLGQPNQGLRSQGMECLGLESRYLRRLLGLVWRLPIMRSVGARRLRRKAVGWGQEIDRVSRSADDKECLRRAVEVEVASFLMRRNASNRF